MVTPMDQSAHAAAARLVPFVIAAVNGAAPFVIAVLIIAPIWLVHFGVDFPFAPLPASIATAYIVIFLLGIFLGRISGTFWLWAGLKTLAIAVVTSALILLLR